MSLKVPGRTNMERLAFLQENLDKNFNDLSRKVEVTSSKRSKSLCCKLVDFLNKL